MRNLTLCLIFLLAAFFALFGRNGIPDLIAFRSQKNELEQILKDIKGKIETEKNYLFGLSTSNEYMEKFSREEFGLSRDGEIVYVFDPTKISPDRDIKDRNIRDRDTNEIPDNTNKLTKNPHK
ncbi:MAG TPA: septum formation initiator family protein [Oligoflexia bacterium]|nr:septum formation initiator family protein [Oligoflexia bacterium]HMP49628.1 septum formation initiator family protein [Oligoflexia bacterium]